jgi:hypothetical protein
LRVKKLGLQPTKHKRSTTHLVKETSLASTRLGATRSLMSGRRVVCSRGSSSGRRGGSDRSTRSRGGGALRLGSLFGSDRASGLVQSAVSDTGEFLLDGVMRFRVGRGHILALANHGIGGGGGGRRTVLRRRGRTRGRQARRGSARRGKTRGSQAGSGHTTYSSSFGTRRASSGVCASRVRGRSGLSDGSRGLGKFCRVKIKSSVSLLRLACGTTYPFQQQLASLIR